MSLVYSVVYALDVHFKFVINMGDLLGAGD